MTEAVVVGSGPNGLAAALRLAQSGVDVRVLEAAGTIGGGTRTTELTVPGVLHDDCSAFHPMGLVSPFLSSLDLESFGLVWRWPEIDLAHPLDTGSAGVLWRDIDRTVEHLGADGAVWRRLYGRLTDGLDDLAVDVLRPVLHVPAHPVKLVDFGVKAVLPASWTAGLFSHPEAKALFGGLAAHAFTSLRAPLSSAVGLMLGAAGHRHGWPVAEGGSAAITTAMAAKLEKLGGTIETGVRVGHLAELGRPDLVLLDVSPRAAVSMAGDRMPPRVARAYGRFRYGPAAFKVDLAVAGGIPWTNEHCRSAGTVHVGGTFAEVAAAERDIVAGRMPARPFMLVGQQYLADPSRSAGDVHPIWAYAHVPQGYGGDATQVIIDQIERFAPGFSSRIVGRHVRNVADLEAYNANYIGGDIGTGANDMLQVALRPRVALDPYGTGIPGVYLCSSATPPGAGVHGMCGLHAAESALRHLAR
jgi:phytoene dehydrogenase-like protein